MVTTTRYDVTMAADAVQLGPRPGCRPLGGVLHAGGVLKDGMLQHVTSSDLREVRAEEPTQGSVEIVHSVCSCLEGLQGQMASCGSGERTAA